MKQNKVYIQNFWYVNNYGACLTAYALYKILENLNYEVKLINVSNLGQNLSYNFNDFINQNCHITKTIKTIDDIKNINKDNSIYITGSDQVFRPYLVKNNLSYFLFDYVKSNSKKIAFSASYGVNKEKFITETHSSTLEKMKTSLKSFDYISVREKSGVEICKDLFDVESEWIIDPVFILDTSNYDELIKNSIKDFSNKIVSYVLNINKEYKKAYKYLSKKYNLEIIELSNSNESIENWLAAIKNCKFLITDSFHGMCFAIIFNKPFICYSTNTGAKARFDSLFEMLDVEDQCIKSFNEISKKDCLFKIDYEKVNQKIEEERQKGLDFLKKALEAPVGKKEEKIEARMKLLENKVYELETQATLKYQIKKELWNLWLIIFHKYLPSPIKNIIRFVRNKICK